MTGQLRRELRPTALTTAATLVTFGVALLIQWLTGQGAALAVLGVVLTLAVRRAARRHRLGTAELVALPLIGLVAAAVGRLLVVHPVVGGALFVVAVSAAVWVRRFGRGAARVGTLLALPFVALLVTPVPPTAGPGHLLWSAVVSMVAVGAAVAAQALEPAPPAPAQPSIPSAPSANRPGRRLDPATRMALQMAVALAVAFVVGRLWFGAHWPWLMVSAYLVNAGTRGRGDVVHKAGLRLAGAAAGTVTATLVAATLPARHPALVVLLFAVLAVASWLRTWSYAAWAAGVTAALALLYGYFGADAAAVLWYRLAAVALGVLVGVAAATLVFPLRTVDVLRRRLADVLAALTGYLVAGRRDTDTLPVEQHRLDHSLDELHHLTPALRAHRRLTRRLRPGPHPADALDAFAGCRTATGPLTDLLRSPDAPVPGVDDLRDDVVALRRALAGRGPVPAPREEQPHPALAPWYTALARTAAALPPRPAE